MWVWVVGLRYLYLAGYDVAESPAVWRTFQSLYGDPSQEASAGPMAAASQVN